MKMLLNAVIKLEPDANSDWTWFIKGMALNGLKKYKEVY